MDAVELLRGDAPFIADTSAWWRVASLPNELGTLLQAAIVDDRLWIRGCGSEKAVDVYAPAWTLRSICLTRLRVNPGHARGRRIKDRTNGRASK